MVLPQSSVKGGVKADQRGGAKLDQRWMVEGLICSDLRGCLERRPAAPLGGAFRPERKAPPQISAIARAGWWNRYRPDGLAGLFRLLSFSR
jgi:hypothetical protein